MGLESLMKFQSICLIVISTLGVLPNPKSDCQINQDITYQLSKAYSFGNLALD